MKTEISYECTDCSWQSMTPPDKNKCPDCCRNTVEPIRYNPPKISMKTEPIPVIVTEPGKGKPVNPYDNPFYSINGTYEARKETFDMLHPILAAIDTKGNALQPREQPYRLHEIKQYQSEDGVWITCGNRFYEAVNRGNEKAGFIKIPTRIAYQLIEDEVKGETAEEFYQSEKQILDNIINTPVNEVESVEQVAERLYPTHNDPTSDPEQYLLRNAFIKGVNYRVSHPIENKEGVKSAEEILFEIGPKALQFQHGVLQAMHTYVAQFSTIEQGKRMVSVALLEKAIENIKSFAEEGDLDTDEDMYNQGLERGIKEIEKVIRSLTQPNQKS